MAIANADGSIILSTKVDTSGMEQGTKSLKSQAAKLAAEYRKAGMSQSEAFKKAWSEIERTRKGTDSATKATKQYGKQAQQTGNDVKAAMSSIGSSLFDLAGQLGLILSITQLIQFGKASGEAATQAEASVKRLIDIYGAASGELGRFIDANAEALGMSKSAAASFSAVYGNLFSAWADQLTNAQLTAEYLKTTAVVASNTGRTMADVQERIRSGLLGNTEAVEDLGIFVNVKTIEMTKAFKKVADGRSWEQLTAYEQSQIRTLAILEQATEKYGEQVAETSALIRAEYKAAYEDFEVSFGNLANEVILPLLKSLTEVLKVATIGLNAINNKSGETVENANALKAAANAMSAGLKDSADNADELGDNTKKAAKEAKRALAGFDEIQKITFQTSEESGSGDNQPNLEGIGSISGQEVANEVSAALVTVMAVVGMSLAALGVVLLFSGHIGWGIGLILAGISAFNVSVATIKSNEVSQTVKDSITNALIIAGTVAVILGAFLCVASLATFPYGIGLIMMGVAALVAPVALNWGGIKEQIQGEFGWTLFTLGATALAIGILLCVVGQFAFGIPLILAGLAGVVTPIVVNWNAIIEAIRGPIGAITAIVSGSLLVLGIILVCCGILPLGIGLIVAGAAGLVTVTAINAGAIVGWLKDGWSAVKDFWNKYIAPVFTIEWWRNLAINAGNGLISGFEGAINGVISLFERMVNMVAEALSALSFEIPDWVPGVGGRTFGFEIPQASFGRVSIPRIATGAVVPNSVSSAVSGRVSGYFAEQGAASSQYTNNNQEVVVVLEVDGREFGRTAFQQTAEESRRLGVSLVAR